MSPAHGPPPGEARIALTSGQQSLRIGCGAAVCLALGLTGVVAGLNLPDGGVVAVVLGGLFTLLGLLLVLGMAKASRQRDLVIDGWGVRHDDPPSGSWAVRWDEIGACEVTQGYHRALTDIGPRTYRVRLVLYPADPHFADRHPEMQALATLAQRSAPGAYVLPLGPARELVPPLSQALATYGQWRFRGFRDEGRLSGGGYL